MLPGCLVQRNHHFSITAASLCSILQHVALTGHHQGGVKLTTSTATLVLGQSIPLSRSPLHAGPSGAGVLLQDGGASRSPGVLIQAAVARSVGHFNGSNCPACIRACRTNCKFCGVTLIPKVDMGHRIVWWKDFPSQSWQHLGATLSITQNIFILEPSRSSQGLDVLLNFMPPHEMKG